MTMEYKNIKLIQANRGQIQGLPRNPRKWTTESVDKLAQSIKETPELLEARPLIVAEREGKYIVLGGNMRLAALKAMKATEAPCYVMPSDTSVEKLKEIVIKDNASFGDWDFDMLTVDWDMSLIEAANIELPESKKKKDVKEDNFDEAFDEVQTICKKGDIWQLGNHRLMCGDSTSADDVSKLMNGELADLWLTDPPYNVAIENSKGMTIENDNMSSEAFLAFLTSAFYAASSVLRSGAAFYVWFASVEHINFENALKDNGLKVREELIWNKNGMILGRQDYQWKHEPCLYGWKDGAAHYFIDSRSETTVIPDADEIDIDKMSKEEMRALLKKIYSAKTPTTIIDEKKPLKDADHPTMKPVRLFGYQIGNSTRGGEIVLDTFAGSGTTIVACEQLGRRARCMELDEHYCDVIIARWEKLTGKKAVKIQN